MSKGMPNLDKLERQVLLLLRAGGKVKTRDVYALIRSPRDNKRIIDELRDRGLIQLSPVGNPGKSSEVVASLTKWGVEYLENFEKSDHESLQRIQNEGVFKEALTKVHSTTPLVPQNTGNMVERDTRTDGRVREAYEVIGRAIMEGDKANAIVIAGRLAKMWNNSHRDDDPINVGG